VTPKFRRGRGAIARAVLPFVVSSFAIACGAVDPTESDWEETVASEGSPTGSSLVPRLTWEACGEDFPGAECALASVPLDYDTPRRAATTIALAKIPATDAGGKIGTVFVNPGGPGGSGVSMILQGFGSYLSELLGGRFDVVGFDPRGVANSDPLLCFENAEERDAFVASMPVFPYLREQERPFFDTNRELTKRCLARGRRISEHMGTADVVRDLDLLRQAVGDRRLTYLGFSYGSYIGNTYANLFPDKVRALVIDGVLDPRLWSSGRQIVADRTASDEVFVEFLRLCDEAAEECALYAEGGSAARYDALANAIKEAPLVFEEEGFVYSYDYLVLDTVYALYAPELWGGPEGYAAFFDFLADAVLGDPDAASEASRVRALIQKRHARPASNQEFYDNWFEAFYGNHCADADYPATFREFRAVGRYAEVDSRFGASWWWFNAPCSNWPSSADRYMGPWTARTSAPVLVVGNYFDPATDYKGAVASDELLPNSRLLSYAGWGHCAFGRSACATEHIVRYLSDGTLPPRNTVCPENPNPFLPVMTLRSSRRAPLIGAPPLRPLRR
jgi:pimeloyl-ACP methyl ester carboxylesterase